MRPHIVWVGEGPLRVDIAYMALSTCESYRSIGNAGATEPDRSFLNAAKRAGAHAIEFSREPNPLAPEFDECLYGSLADVVAAWVKRTIAER